MTEAETILASQLIERMWPLLADLLAGKKEKITREEALQELSDARRAADRAKERIKKTLEEETEDDNDS
jgi:hypothetical protein